MTDKVKKIRAEIERMQSRLDLDNPQGLGAAINFECLLNFIDSLQEEPVSEDLEDACEQLAEKARMHKAETTSPFFSQTDYKQGVIDGAKWQKNHLWKHADGDDLPEIDREVIALLDNGKVVFAHRPPEYWDGKNIVTGKVTRNYPKTYDKGGWNIPDVKWWLDCQIPKMGED